MRYTYLLIDFFTLLVPFVFSFHPRFTFSKTWKAFFPAVVITGLLFVVDDVWFTSLGVWGFNSRYVTGIKIANLPIEEVLFFFCIPYSCVFTYFCAEPYIQGNFAKTAGRILSPVLLLASLVFAVVYRAQWYTCFTFSFLAVLLLLAQYILKAGWLFKFYAVYGILLVPFIIVNGLLTGTGLAAPVVWYNPAHIWGLRILTIPVEDIFYGMDLVLMNTMIYNHLLARNIRQVR